MGNILRSFGFSSHENPRNPTEIHENLKKELIFPWITFCNRESMIIHGQITVDFRLFTKIHVYKLRGFPLQTEIHENEEKKFPWISVANENPCKYKVLWISVCKGTSM